MPLNSPRHFVPNDRYANGPRQIGVSFLTWCLLPSFWLVETRSYACGMTARLRWDKSLDQGVEQGFQGFASASRQGLGLFGWVVPASRFPGSNGLLHVPAQGPGTGPWEKGDAKKLGGRIFHMMGLVHYHLSGPGAGLLRILPAYHQIREEQVMIDNHQTRAPPQPSRLKTIVHNTGSAA